MQATLLILTVTAGFVMAIAAIVTVLAVRRAPEGIETEEGFRSLARPAVRASARSAAPGCIDHPHRVA